ncbi:hypothetical protein [Agrococcus sp. SGAir0287]|uniref:hypothetical protein n=1 Tax=Agrococcus sp. SGAir0287 TaxID=2070347 RepID=UPI001586F02C|nr:hypothetical protein [Agrococcus sp. SGAir0287]
MATRREERDERRFVQIAERPSLGVELPSGTPWVGVDRQVGHGSADALFALTDAQYSGALVDSWTALDGFEAECWRGEHPDLERFGPGGAHWRPEGWLPRRARMLPQAFEGELWRIVDAVDAGDPDGERMAIAGDLARGALHVEGRGDRPRAIVVPLVGDVAYPRPSALVGGGLGPGAARDDVERILGAPTPGERDAHAVEGVLVRARYDDAGGLVALAVERRPTPEPPAGAIGVLLAAVGEPEEGDAYRAVARLDGATSRRWVPSSGHARRLIAFDAGIEVHVEDLRVLGVRADLVARAEIAEGPGRAADPVLAALGATDGLATRADVHRMLGAPLDARGRVELRRFGRCDLLFELDGDGDDAIATSMTAVQVGVSISPTMHRWRSGDLTRFLDALGRPASEPLVAALQQRDGVRVRLEAGVVDAVEIQAPGPLAASFLDGMPEAPERGDIPLGWPPYALEREDAWRFDQGWVHVHAPDGRTIGRIVVQRSQPPGLGREGDGTRWWAERFRPGGRR